MRKRKKWLIVVAVVLAVGLSYLAYSLVVHTQTEYITVSELGLRAESLYDKWVRVEGRIAPGSINWDDKAKTIKFTLTDDKDSLNVIYEGVVPDNFKPGVEMIVEGRYRTNVVFEAASFGSRRSICNLCH